jgi:hypothetical protein
MMEAALAASIQAATDNRLAHSVEGPACPSDENRLRVANGLQELSGAQL